MSKAEQRDLGPSEARIRVDLPAVGQLDAHCVRDCPADRTLEFGGVREKTSRTVAGVSSGLHEVDRMITPTPWACKHFALGRAHFAVGGRPRTTDARNPGGDVGARRWTAGCPENTDSGFEVASGAKTRSPSRAYGDQDRCRVKRRARREAGQRIRADRREQESCSACCQSCQLEMASGAR